MEGGSKIDTSWAFTGFESVSEATALPTEPPLMPVSTNVKAAKFIFYYLWNVVQVSTAQWIP